MTRERIEQVAMIALSIGMFMAVAFYLLFKPQMTKLRNVTSDLKRIEEQLADAQNKVESLPRSKAQCRAFEDKVADAEKAFVGDGSFPAILSVIKRCADTAKIDMKNSTPREDILLPRGSAYAERWVTIETIATYHALGNWLAALEAESPYIRIVSVKISADQEKGGAYPTLVTISFLAKKGTP